MGDIKSVTADLFVGQYYIVLSLHVYSICVNRHKSKISVQLFPCWFLRWLTFVAQKLLWEAEGVLSCLQHKKLLKTLKVALNVPSIILQA